MDDAALNLVVVGASAGGVHALCALLGGLPAELPAAMCIVMHLPTSPPSALDAVLGRASQMPVRKASDGCRLRHGEVLIATNDQHVVIDGAYVRLTRGPRENRSRPAIDVLFRSAALSFSSHATGIILTGMLGDGTAGLWAIKDRGGTTIVQSRTEAEFDSMPLSALEHVIVDHEMTLSDIALSLPSILGKQRPPIRAADSRRTEALLLERDIATGDLHAIEKGVMGLGEFSSNTCPECHGVLMSIREGSQVRYRCHTGHAYSGASLFAALDAQIEDNLWGAVRSMEERAFLFQRLKAQATEVSQPEHAARYEALADAAIHRAERIKAIVMEPGGSGA